MVLDSATAGSCCKGDADVESVVRPGGFGARDGGAEGGVGWGEVDVVAGEEGGGGGWVRGCEGKEEGEEGDEGLHFWGLG